MLAALDSQRLRGRDVLGLEIGLSKTMPKQTAIARTSRARDRAKELGTDPASKDARLSLPIDLTASGDYVTDATLAELVELFAEMGNPITLGTLDNNAAEAARIIRMASDPSSAVTRYWQRAAQHDREVDAYVAATIEQAGVNIATSPKEVKENSEAVAKALEARERTIERAGKVAGLIAGPSNVVVTVDVGGEKKTVRGAELAEFWRLTWAWFEQLRPDDYDRFAAWVESGGVLEVGDE